MRYCLNYNIVQFNCQSAELAPALTLFEILYAALEQLLILCTGNVDAYTVAHSLGVTHLTKYSAVG